jgi:hypothetical protein
MASKPPPLFQDDREADDTLVRKSAILGDLCVASHLRLMWKHFHRYADTDFVSKLRRGVRGLRENQTPGAPRSEAYYLFHRCYWEMHVGCALLEQEVKLVPRAQWHKSWKGAGPDLWAIVDGRNVWIECVAPGAGTGVDAVPELEDDDDREAQDVPVAQINLRLLAVLKDKREKFKGYIQKGIVKSGDAVVVAINSHGVPMAFLSVEPPWIAKSLYGLGHQAVDISSKTMEVTDTYLTRQPSITKQNEEAIDADLFGSGRAAEVSGAIYSSVDAWNPVSSPSRGVLFVHNRTASVPLPNRWLPLSVSYSVTVTGNKGTIHRADPEPR